MKHSAPVTWTQRKEASRIITAARNAEGMTAVAKRFGLVRAYISTAEHMNVKRRTEYEIVYYCPASAIRKILEIGK